MTSRPPSAWDYYSKSGDYTRTEERDRERERERPSRQPNDNNPNNIMNMINRAFGGTNTSNAVTTYDPTAKEPDTHHHRRSESQQRLTRRLSLSNPAEMSRSSRSPTKHSSASNSTNSSSSSSNPMTTSTATTASTDRGLSSSRTMMPAPPSRQAPAPPTQQLFTNPHGIREPASSARPRPASMVILPPAFHAPPPLPPPQMPGAFPSDDAPSAPYRRPTTTINNDWTGNKHAHVEPLFSQLTLSDSWDSEEGDSGSNLSTSTAATTVASDVTSSKGAGGSGSSTSSDGQPYMMATALGGSGSSPGSGTTTPTQSLYQHEYNDGKDQARLKPTQPRASILRKTPHKSVLSSSSTKTSTASSASSSRTATQSSAHHHHSSLGEASGSSRRSSMSGRPNIHIEVHGPDSRRNNSHSEARIRQKIEEVLLDKIVQLRTTDANTTTAADDGSTKKADGTVSPPKVRFAEQVAIKEDSKPTKSHQSKSSSNSSSSSSSNSKNKEAQDSTALSRELAILQEKEIHKLEVEREKRDLLLKERERIDQERKVQEERAREDHERARQNLEIERRELAKATKSAQEERAKLEREKKVAQEAREKERTLQLEREKKESERKEREKAAKAQAKEREAAAEQEKKKRAEEEKRAKEKKRAEDKAKEFETLQKSFVDQGRILTDLKERFETQQRTLESTEAERAELAHDKAQFERRCSDLSRSLSHVSDKERYVVEQVASLQIIKESLQKRVGPLEERMTALRAELTGLQAERDGLMKETKTHLERITELEKDIKGLVEEKRGFIAQMSDLQKERTALKDTVKELEANIEARAKDYSEHIATLRSEHQKAADELEGQITSLKDDHTRQLEAQLTTLTAAHKLQTDEWQERLADLQEHVDGAHNDVDKLSDTVKTLESSLTKEKARTALLTADNERISTDLTGHQLLAVTQETNILTLREDIARRSDALAKLQESNKALQAEHDELKKQQQESEEEKKVVDNTESPPSAPPPTTDDEENTKKMQELETKNAELTTQNADLNTEKADLITQHTAAKTALEERLLQLEGDHSALLADKTALADEAAKVPALLAEKAALETQAGEAASLCARLNEQLAAANKLIEGLTAAQVAGLTPTMHNVNTGGPGSGAASQPVTPLSPTFPAPPPTAPPTAPASETASVRKMRSRAPSMSRSVSSRGSRKLGGGGIRDDIALVMVRTPGDRGNVTIMRKSELRQGTGASLRSRSQPPEKEE